MLLNYEYYLVKIFFEKDSKYAIMARYELNKAIQNGLDIKEIYKFNDVKDTKNFIEQMQEYKSAINAYNSSENKKG